MLFKINGERNSGTNFIEKLIEKNFGNTFCQETIDNTCFYWKHGIPRKEIKEKDDIVIDIFIFRELGEWLISMYKNPYHLIRYKSFHNFLIKKQISNEKKIKEPETLLEINYDDNGKDIFKIRYYKYLKIMDYFKTNNNIILVNHNFLKNNENCKIFLDEINKIYKIKNDNNWQYINEHTKTGDLLKYRIYDINLDDFQHIINSKKNVEIETELNNLTFIIKS